MRRPWYIKKMEFNNLKQVEVILNPIWVGVIGLKARFNILKQLGVFK